MTRIDKTEAEPDGPGRRERKKAATRQALADAALRLFLEKGFDQVKVAEVAEAADTALTTLFAHFPGGKEALILEDGAEREESLALAVRGRADGVSVLEALRAFFAGRGPFDPDPAPEFLLKTQLVVATPALRAYARRMWTGCEEPLAAVIAEECGRPAGDDSLRILARYVLEIPDLAGMRPDPRRALETAFDHLERGWPGV
ncbi:TetR/AcrR family transcriptional regulator [Streptomyces sp. NPDC051546]|uniref:TetR/AcrR family transcriptional regulator n=1 Tax=Streptomyces sp. NPDC051546 TaxID=3365655 RepID=UPI0037B47D64